MRKLISLLLALTMMVFTAGVVGAQPSTDPVDPQEGCEYFEDTSHNLCEPFLAFWDTNGGLPVFGYPVTEQAEELNLDLQEVRNAQYFERERLEHHPENAGSPYEVLLGRLGNEVLLMQDRDWQTFPKGDPSAENYFEITGHAIAPEFYAYWSSHGLDLGDDGYSFAESLALFGYPISEAEMETNSSGDTVLTQWFERARFEFHPDNPEDSQVLLGLLGNEILASAEPPPPPAAPGEVIAEGLNNPRHVNVAADGTVYVAEAGAGGDACVNPDPEDPEFQLCFGNTGGVTAIVDGEQTRIAELPSNADPSGTFATGPHDAVMGEDGSLAVTLGLGAPSVLRDMIAEQVDIAQYFATIVSVGEDGTPTVVADLGAWENENNPDGLSDFGDLGADSNPYGIAMLDDGSYVATDAGGNTLLHVAADGTITPIAVFETRMVEVPAEFQEPGGPTEIPMHMVPTSVVQGPDGAWYVGQLTGFPFPVGGANVYRVTEDGEVSVYADGFSAIIDITFDDAGNLYVAEMAKNGLLAAEMAAPGDWDALTGAVTMVAPDGTRTELASEGLIAPGGVAVGADGTVYVSNYSVFPGMGQVVAIQGEEPPPPAGPEVVLSGLNNPRGIDVTADGTVYVAEAGAGGEECTVGPGPEGDEVDICWGFSSEIAMTTDDGQAAAVSGLPSILFGMEPSGAHDVVVTGEGAIYGVTGLGADPARRAEFGDVGAAAGHLITGAADGNWELATDISAYEADANPDGGAIDSNPFSLVATDDGGFVVSDAGMNALLTVAADGTISTLAAFEDRMVDAPPFLELPEGTQIPMQTVPTGLVEGPDGAYYVGELTGFPFVNGSARVWRVTAEGEAEVYAEGFTNVIDVAFDADGNLYVLEMLTGGLLNANPEDPSTLASRLVKVAPDGTQTDVASEGLVWATGLDIGPDGSIYVSNFGVMPGQGTVVRLDPAS